MTFRPLTKEQGEVLGYPAFFDPFDEKNLSNNSFGYNDVRSAVQYLKNRFANALEDKGDIDWHNAIIDFAFPVFVEDSLSQPNGSISSEEHGCRQCGGAGELSSVSVGEVDVKHAARKGCTCACANYWKPIPLCGCECHKDTHNKHHTNVGGNEK